MSLDRSWAGLQLFFWFRGDRTKRSAANSRKQAAGVTAPSQPKDESRDFSTERFILSSWTQKMFGRAL